MQQEFKMDGIQKELRDLSRNQKKIIGKLISFNFLIQSIRFW